MGKPKNPRMIRIGLVVLVGAVALLLLLVGPWLKKNSPGASTSAIDKTLFLEIRDEEGNFLCTTPRCRGFYSEDNLPKIQEWMTAISRTDAEEQRKTYRDMLNSNLVSSERLILSIRKRGPLGNPDRDPQPNEGAQVDEFPYNPPPPEAGI